MGVWDFNATLLRVTMESGLCGALDQGEWAVCSTQVGNDNERMVFGNGARVAWRQTSG